jgi:hypothetical protein
VNSDHYQFAGVFAFQFPQLRKYVHAVNSTVRPEVEDQYLAIEIGKSKRAIRVKPVKGRREVWRVYRAGELSWTHFINPYC